MLAFVGLHSVIVINLNNNNIKSLSRAMFQPLQNLKTVYLRDNPFQSLELNLFNYASALIIVFSTDIIQCCHIRTAT